MNQLQIHQILHSLLQHSNRMASDKVAIRWLFANLMLNAKDYDLFFRLQVLEGALGVREGVWWTKGRAGLAEAKRAATSFPDMNPDWLEPGNTGMFKIMHNLVGNFVKRARIQTSADDALQSALMGLGKNLDSIKKPAFEVGKLNSMKIQDGKETPQSIGAGVLSRWIGRKAANEAQKNESQELDDSILENRPQNRHLKEESMTFLAQILFGDMSNPVGKKVRNAMRKSWAGTGQEEIMDTWMDLIENKKNPTKSEMAKRLGIAPGTFYSRHWGPAWKKTIYDLIHNSSIIRLLDNYLAGKGYEFSVPDLANIFPDVR